MMEKKFLCEEEPAGAGSSHFAAEGDAKPIPVLSRLENILFL